MIYADGARFMTGSFVMDVSRHGLSAYISYIYWARISRGARQIASL